jgi:WD40 repeat protein
LAQLAASTALRTRPQRNFADFSGFRGTFKGHEGAVTVARFSPDGQFIVSGSLDRTLKLWDVRTGRCYPTLASHSDVIFTLLVASVQVGDEDFARLTTFSGSLDESIKLWDLQANKCWPTLRVPRPYEGMKIEGIQGLTEAQWATLKALGAVPEARSLSYS